MKDSIENELFQKIHTYAISNTQAINLSLIHTMTPTVKNKDIEINFSYKSLDKTPEPPHYLLHVWKSKGASSGVITLQYGIMYKLTF